MTNKGETRTRIWEIILYPVDNAVNLHAFVLQGIIDSCMECGYKYFMILHDKDIDEDGQLKKEHVHILLEFPNPRRIKSVMREMCVLEENLVNPVTSKKGYIRYLTHIDDKDKYQYKQSNIQTNCKTDVERAYKCDKDSIEQAEYMLNYICANPNSSITELSRVAIDNGCWSQFRSGFNVFSAIRIEHLETNRPATS